MSTGHHRLADGSLVRVDFERGHWVGRLYTPEMNVKSQILGTDAEVHAWANAFVALRPADSSRWPAAVINQSATTSTSSEFAAEVSLA